jgi:hypothetical protein
MGTLAVSGSVANTNVYAERTWHSVDHLLRERRREWSPRRDREGDRLRDRERLRERERERERRRPRLRLRRGERRVALRTPVRRASTRVGRDLGDLDLDFDRDRCRRGERLCHSNAET